MKKERNALFVLSCLLVMMFIPVSLVFPFGDKPVLSKSYRPANSGSVVTPSENGLLKSEMLFSKPLEGAYRPSLDSKSAGLKGTGKLQLEDSSTSNYYQIMPEVYKNSFVLLTPTTHITTLKNEVLFKGINKFLTPVFINGMPVEVFKDGRFSYTQSLSKKGLYVFVITYTTPDFKTINIIRKVLHLDPPPAFVLDQKKKGGKSELKNKDLLLTYYFNSPFISPSHPIKSLSEPITRADLAFFIAQLNNNKITHLPVGSQEIFKDVSSNFWAAPYIQYVASENILTEYPDGKFYPEKTVRKIDYVIALIKAYRYPLADATAVLPFKDIKVSHWTSRYVKTALDHQVIPSSAKLNPDKELTFDEFIQLAMRLKEVKATLTGMMNTHSVSLNAEWASQINRRIEPVLKERAALLVKKSTIEIVAPVDFSVASIPTISIKGKLRPAGNFTINQIPYQTLSDGRFGVTLNMTATVNHWVINANGVTKSITTYLLIPSADIKGHWLAGTITKARYLHLMDQVPTLNLKQKVTKAEFARYTRVFFDLKPTGNATANIILSDVTQNTPYYDDIKILLQHKILTGDRYQEFHPSNNITRMEALACIIKAAELTNSKDIAKSAVTDLPYRNISKKNWGYAYLSIAYQHNMIAKARYFKAKSEITQAELLAILTKTPAIKEKLNRLFE